MPNFIQVTPFMHVDNLERALAFFTDILGFRTRFRVANYAYAHYETAGFRLLEQTGADGAPPGNRRFAYYIDVCGVDGLYAELQPKLDTLPKGDGYGPSAKAMDSGSCWSWRRMATCSRLARRSPENERPSPN